MHAWDCSTKIPVYVFQDLSGYNLDFFSKIKAQYEDDDNMHPSMVDRTQSGFWNLESKNQWNQYVRATAQSVRTGVEYVQYG